MGINILLEKCTVDCVSIATTSYEAIIFYVHIIWKKKRIKKYVYTKPPPQKKPLKTKRFILFYGVVWTFTNGMTYYQIKKLKVNTLFSQVHVFPLNNVQVLQRIPSVLMRQYTCMIQQKRANNDRGNFMIYCSDISQVNIEFIGYSLSVKWL